MKKIISLLLAGGMLFSLVGCGKKGAEVSDGDIPTLTWILPSQAQSDVASVQDALNEIFVEEVGAKVELQFIEESAFKEKMKMKMASGEDFDMCFTGYVNNYETAAKNGGILDITDYIDQVEGLREAIPDYSWECSTINGRIYGVPNLQIACSTTSAIEYTDISDKYDFDFSKVKNMNDLEPYFEMIKKDDPGAYPYLPAYGVNPWYTGKYLTIGTKMLAFPLDGKSSDELCYMWETEEWKKGVNTLWDWYQKGYIRPDILSSVDDTTDRKSGRIAVDTDLWKPGVEISWKTNYGRDNKFWPIQDSILTRSNATSTMVSLGLSCKDPIKALKIVKLTHTDPRVVNLLTFGIEGKHYNLVNNRVEPIEGSGYDQKSKRWKFGNSFLGHLVPGEEDDVMEQTKKVNEEAVKPTTLKFSFDTDPVKTEISNISSILTEYEAYNKGAVDPATYMDEFVKKLKEAGIERVYDEAKKQLDEYFASEN